MTTKINTLDELAKALGGYSYRSGSLDRLCSDVADTLIQKLKVAFETERRLAPGLVADFFLPDLGIVIDCWVYGHSSDVQSQVARFAEQRDVEGIVLLSSRTAHEPKLESITVAFLYVGGGKF